MSLPPPSASQPFCSISALEAGHVNVPHALFLSTADLEARQDLPALSFVITHLPSSTRLLFDLGIRRDWQNIPPITVRRIHELPFHITVHQDAAESLKKGGIQPEEVQYVVLSHAHFDHYGDTAPYTRSTFLVGGESRGLFEPGYPADPDSPFASDLLPPDRTRWLDVDASWKPLGPFPYALDFFGDGSLYLVDAPGHLPGHINALVRTSADGGWVYLAGDSAHDWAIIRGNGDIARTERYGCGHLDLAVAKEHIGRIRDLLEKNASRVRVILAHDKEWYEENKGGSAYFPGTMKSL